MINELTNEQKLVLLFMDFYPTKNNKSDFVALLDKPIDWVLFRKAISANKLGVWVFKTIDVLQLKDYFPEYIFQAYKKKYLHNLLVNTKRVNTFKQILAHLKALSIDAIPLKGMYLIDKVYTDFGVRSMCDIDLLVRTADVQKCVTVFSNLGWEVKKFAFRSIQFSHHPYVFSKNNVRIELHHELYPFYENYTIPMSDIWQRAKSKAYLNTTVYQLDLCDLIIHLKLHLYKHYAQGQCYLKSFLDILLVLKTYQSEVDYKAMNQMVKTYNCSHEIDFIDSVLYTFFFSDEDKNIFTEQKQINKHATGLFLKMLNGEITESLKYVNDNHINTVDNHSKVKALPKIKDKLRYITERLFPDKKYMKSHYRVNNWFQLQQWYLRRLFFKQRIENDE